MKSENSTTNKSTRIWWATASLVLSLVGWVSAVLLYNLYFLFDTELESFAIFWAFLCWVLSLIFGVVALVKIIKRRRAFKGTIEAIIGICVSAFPVVVFAIGMIYLRFVVFRGEPYDESHPASVVATIEGNCGFKFPEKIESLKAADKLAGGIDNPYYFIVIFTTDQSGFAQLRASLSQLGDWREITDELSQKDYDSDYYDPRDFSDTKYTPQWYRMKIVKGRTYEGFLVSRNNRMRLFTFCVELAEPNKVRVYMEGWGDPSLKKDKDTFR